MGLGGCGFDYPNFIFEEKFIIILVLNKYEIFISSYQEIGLLVPVPIPISLLFQILIK